MCFVYSDILQITNKQMIIDSHNDKLINRSTDNEVMKNKQ